LLSYLEMFDYFKRARLRLIEALEKMSNEEFTKNRGLSFENIKDVLVHTVMVEDNWLHYRFPGLGASTNLQFQDFKNIEDVKKYITEVDAKTAKFFSRLTDQDLRKQVKRPLRSGGEEFFELEHVLYQLPIEVIYHFGEIFAEFWRMNIDAPYYSYLAYAKEKSL